MTDPTDNPRPDQALRSATLALKPDRATDAPAVAEEARVAKVLSRAGLCSRRDAEGWILAGRVAVNGTLIASPALNVGPDDVITVDGHPIDKADRTRLFMFHKTRGLVTTAKDPEGRPTIYDALPDDLPRLITIGRLDINTEGLLLLTNDGGLARLLELPSTGWLRRYRVRAKGLIDQPALDALSDGVTVDGVDYAGIEAKLDRVQGSNLWLTMGLREGKNREIKRVLEHLGLLVNRLIRISFGPFQLGDLEENAVEEVRTQVLRDQLGPALAREAGVDLEGPATAAVVTREVRKAKADERRAGKPREGASAERAKPPRDPQMPRQHVSALRASRAESAEGPRRKTQRGETADRNGRAVAVERVTVAVRKKSATAPTRNARRFETERREAGQDERPAGRRERSFAGGRDGTRDAAARPERGRTREDRPPRAETGEGRPARGEPRPRTVRQADAGFKSRSRSDEGAARSAPRGSRAATGERPRRAEGSEGRPARAPSRDERPRIERPRPERSRDERPSGGATRPSRSGGDKSGFKGKPRAEGRPGRSTSGDRPATGRKPPGGGSGRTRPGQGGGGGRGRPPRA